jgi:hypothetical protein
VVELAIALSVFLFAVLRRRKLHSIATSMLRAESHYFYNLAGIPLIEQMTNYGDAVRLNYFVTGTTSTCHIVSRDGIIHPPMTNVLRRLCNLEPKPF